ncbi:MAG TPA: diguanylate cyclase [Clostridia bacterium]|nr:diguanylate cyclase [Clostridia bacterium]
MQFLDKFFGNIFLRMNYANSAEFEKKYTLICLQRGRLFKWVTFFACLFSLYLDLILNKDGAIDALYRRVLLSVHIAGLALSLVYIIIYSALKRSQQYRFSRASKATVISDMFLSLLAGAILSLNSQRFTGNIDAYILMVFAVALVIPMYPKWVVGIYGVVHLFFLIALSSFQHGNAIIIKQSNSTTIVLVALVVFIVLYKNNVSNFLNEERLREGKATFTRLFETNPFPLLISSFEDGRILNANQKAMLYFGVQKEQLSTLTHKELYKNASDVDIIHEMLRANTVLNNYMAEQKTLTGEAKHSMASYELIDYMGEKSILIGVTDLAQIKRMEHELTIHASMDILTGIFNRRVGMDLIRKRYEMTKREGGGFILCFIDLDNLKMVNDKFGHLEGDAFIIHTCRIIKEEVNPNDIIFRYGGDEFMIVFHDDDDRAADQTCRRLADKFEALNRSNFKPYPINASMGIFSYKSEMNLNLEQIIEIVDKNMYSNKMAKK